MVADDGRKTSDAGRFQRFAALASVQLGSPWAFLAAAVVVIVWAAAGAVFHFSETWQMVINTGTTIITFLMVFIIQATQNRDAKAIHLKLDELIRASEARNVFANLENASDAELESFQRDFELLRTRSRDVDGSAESRETRADFDAGTKNAT